ncbi:MAG TPA: glycosyltransferase family 2 protein [Aeromonadales bacterium]|nr:glycosyltransferase family 2 protein [Aeromonadales bacterium]
MTQNIKPTVSVIIAVYNGEKTIKRAIDSILQQTWPVNEIIIIDDGSTDNTRQVLADYKDKITTLHQQNAGVSVARNKGVEQAKSDWICFLDADDWYYPDRIKWHMEMIQQNPKLDFLTGDFDYIDENGNILRQSMQSTKCGSQLLQLAGDKSSVIMQGDLIGEFVEQHFGDTHTLTLKRADFFKLGGYPQGVAVCEDVNFLIRLCAVSRYIGVKTLPMAAYFIHSNSATRSDPLRAQQQTLLALQSLKMFIKETNNSLMKGLMKSIRHARLDLAYVLLKNNKKSQALQVVLPMIYEVPGIKSIKYILSVVKG